MNCIAQSIIYNARNVINTIYLILALHEALYLYNGYKHGLFYKYITS